MKCGRGNGNNQTGWDNISQLRKLKIRAMTDKPNNRPHTTVVLAMSADGKIADAMREPARFSSAADQQHLEQQIAAADGVLFGAGTLRAYGTTLSVSHSELLQKRQQQNLSPQPVQIVASRTAEINPQIRFFRQRVPHWLITTKSGAKQWEAGSQFEQILVCDTRNDGEINWKSAFEQLSTLGLSHLAVLGGGELVASLMAANLIDEFWLTVCPLILGGANAPTPVAGTGFYPENLAPRLELLSVKAIDQEVFLHYRLQQQKD